MSDDLKIAQAWIQMVESDPNRIREQPGDIYPRLRDWARQVWPTEILDLGCGQGICSEHLGLVDQNYTGIDASPHLIARARAKYAAPSRRFVQGEIEALPFAAAAFDAIFSVTVWHLLPDLQVAAGEFRRVLRAPGNFLLIVPNPEAYALWQERYSHVQIVGPRLEGRFAYPDGSIGTDVWYLHPEAEIIGALEGVGLEIRKREKFRESGPSRTPMFLAIQGVQACHP